MLHIVRHRVNGLAALSAVAPEHGAEIDVRSRAGRLILAHDPHVPGEPLERFLDAWKAQGRRGLLILNPKEDGLERELLRQLRRRRIENFVLLDLAAPTLVRLALRERVGRVAVRVSEHEPESAAAPFAGRARWVWLDSFTGRPPSPALARRLRRAFKVCLVSPELQGHPRSRIAAYRALRGAVDAVCTKFPDSWRR